MDFSLTEAQTDLAGLTRTIASAISTPERQKELDRQDSRFDWQLWTKLVEADILSTAAPESLGGGGFGVLEQSSILVELGRELAAVPYLESVVLAAGALAAFGSEALQNDWAAPAVAGKKVLTIARRDRKRYRGLSRGSRRCGCHSRDVAHHRQRQLR
jgi:alkylation response protein AidB-like acyl-CoA dehydrogenase